VSGTARLLGPVEVQALLPHRHPFLLVDAVEVLEPGKKAVGRKGVTMNEPFFPGHFPGRPLMPGVLILEALAQTAGVLLADDGTLAGKLGVFIGIEEAKFRHPVTPGSLLELHVEVLRSGSRAAKVRGVAYIAGGTSVLSAKGPSRKEGEQRDGHAAPLSASGTAREEHGLRAAEAVMTFAFMEKP
jgi:3-hydroxyacyl-[acyl-carrier-protein] dehydratase